MNVPLTSTPELDRVRDFLELLLARINGSDAPPCLKMVLAICKLVRAVIALERELIGSARRAAVLASPALRQAAFAYIGLLAILRWEAAWTRRHLPIKQQARPAAQRKTPQAKAKPDVPYALMPIPPKPRQRKARTSMSMSFAAFIPAPPKPLPPAYVYPHEICVRPAIWAKERPAQQSAQPSLRPSFPRPEPVKPRADAHAKTDADEPSIRAGPDSKFVK